MLVQNKIFTAESPRTQDKVLDRCHSHQTISISIPKACLPVGREEAFDPIAVSSPSQRLSEPAADWIKRKYPSAISAPLR